MNQTEHVKADAINQLNQKRQFATEQNGPSESQTSCQRTSGANKSMSKKGHLFKREDIDLEEIRNEIPEDVDQIEVIDGR